MTYLVGSEIKLHMPKEAFSQSRYRSLEGYDSIVAATAGIRKTGRRRIASTAQGDNLELPKAPFGATHEHFFGGSQV